MDPCGLTPGYGFAGGTCGASGCNGAPATQNYGAPATIEGPTPAYDDGNNSTNTFYENQPSNMNSGSDAEALPEMTEGA